MNQIMNPQYMNALLNSHLTKDITFLNEIDIRIRINKNAKYQYILIHDWDLINFELFISSMNEFDTYLIMPFISTTKKSSDPSLRLCSQFLITRRSDPYIIKTFLIEKWHESDFEIPDTCLAYLYFKFKSVDLEKI